MKKLGVGIVGAGGIAQRNARETHDSGVASISGVFDVNHKAARELSRALKAPVFDSYQSLLESPETDAVLLSLPHHLHRPMAVQAAEHGKHILIEKPLANNLDEAEDILRACEKAGVQLSVNYSFRYLPKIRLARQIIEEGGIGEVCGVQAVVHQYKDKGYWAGGRSNSPDDWRGSKAKCGGGFLIMNLCHVIDYLAFITGLDVKHAYAEYSTLGSPIEVEDIISVSYRLENGAIGSICGSSIMRGMEVDEQRIWGTNGSLVLSGEGIQLYSTRPVINKRPGKVHKIRKFPDVSWTAEWIRAFNRSLENGSDPETGRREGWKNLAFIEACYRSLENGKPSTLREYPGDESVAARTK